MKTIGIILIVIGVIGLAWGGFNYVKHRDTANIGPLQVSVTQKEHVSIPPVVSAVVLVAGGVLLGVGMRKRSV